MRPCPFCGGEAYASSVSGETFDDYHVCCWECGAMVHDYDCEIDAAEAWNRRAERTCRVEAEKLKLSHTQTALIKSCSECGHEFGAETHYEGMFDGMVLHEVELPNYCPNCGARVEGKSE